jgi:hypothetical protein
MTKTAGSKDSHLFADTANEKAAKKRERKKKKEEEDIREKNKKVQGFYSVVPPVPTTVTVTVTTARCMMIFPNRAITRFAEEYNITADLDIEEDGDNSEDAEEDPNEKNDISSVMGLYLLSIQKRIRSEFK